LIGFGLLSTLVLALGGMTWVLISFFFDLISPFSVLCGVFTMSVIWLWLSEDSTYFYLFLILFSISGPLVFARNLSCYFFSIFMLLFWCKLLLTWTIFYDFVAYVLGVDILLFLVDFRYELLFLVDGYVGS